MEFVYKDDFEDIILSSEELISYYKCPLIESMSINETAQDLRKAGFSALKRACTTFLWKVEEAHKKGEKIPPLDDLKSILKKQLDTIRLSELLALPHLFERINKFLTDIDIFYEFLEKQKDKLHSFQLVGYDHIKTTIGNKFTIELPVDLLFTRKVGKGVTNNLVILCSPFNDLEIYRLLSSVYVKAFKDSRIDIHEVYLINFNRTPVKIPGDMNRDHFRQLEIMLKNLYDTYIQGQQPIAEFFSPGQMRICFDCIYNKKCRDSSRLELIKIAQIASKYK
jgi:hypothetical protein